MPITNQDELDQAAGLLELFTSTLSDLVHAVATGSMEQAGDSARQLISQHAEAIRQ